MIKNNAIQSDTIPSNKSKISKAIKLGMIALKGIESKDDRALSFLSYCIDYARSSDKKSRLKDCEIFEDLIHTF